jgi:hypothetical protein
MSGSQIAAQFNAPLPRKFSDLYAGGAYVPAGTTNGLQQLIPSSGRMSASQFLGAPNGIQLVDYYTNFGYYFRDIPNYLAANTPQSSIGNNNASNWSTPPGGGTYGTILWQNYYFSNASQKTSQGCTVIFSIAGKDTTYEGVKAAVPGGSATGAVQVAAGKQAFYVWAEANKHLLAPTWLYVDYQQTSAFVLTVVAWYACSPTAITKVTGAWDSNGISKHAAQYPQVQILPGFWTPTPVAFPTTSYTATLQPNTPLFVASARDGDGNYVLERPASIPYWEYADHWYDNASYQWSYNTSAGAVSTTYAAQGSSEKGVIYSFTQNGASGYTGPNKPNGSTIRGFGSAIISAKTALNGGTSQTASVVFLPSGGAYGTGDGSTVMSYDSSFGGGADVVPAWYVGATFGATPPGNSYWLRATATSVSTGTTVSSNVGSWIPLSSQQTISATYTGTGSGSATFSYDIATDSSGSNAVNIGTTTHLIANSTSTGGGSGGGCVAASMMLDMNRSADGVAVGDLIDGVTYNPDGISPQTVRSNLRQLEQCWRMTTVSGIVLDASDSTPVTLKDGSSKMFNDSMVGELVLVDDRGAIRWEKVTSMQKLEYEVVVRLSVDDHSYFAGARGDRRIATHNVLK